MIGKAKKIPPSKKMSGKAHALLDFVVQPIGKPMCQINVGRPVILNFECVTHVEIDVLTLVHTADALTDILTIPDARL